MNFKIARNVPHNDFIINFYNNNTINNITYNKSNSDNLLLCTYNVHGWVNINANINYIDNFNNIVTLLSKINADIVVLQEVCLTTKLTSEYITDTFEKYGYIDHVIVPNGGCFLNKTKYDYLLVLSKQNLALKESIDVTEGGFKRNCVIIKYDDIKILCVHLEIGKRLHHLPENSPSRKNIEKYNYMTRIKQLNKIFNKHNDINIIIGDFNFMPSDSESKWLLARKYKYYGNDTNTTPYNRTDMLFANGLDICNTVDVVCNYSDHLPVLYEVNIK